MISNFHITDNTDLQKTYLFPMEYVPDWVDFRFTTITAADGTVKLIKSPKQEDQILMMEDNILEERFNELQRLWKDKKGKSFAFQDCFGNKCNCILFNFVPKVSFNKTFFSIELTLLVKERL